MDNKAQISLELIVLMAAVLAVVVLLVTQLQETGVTGTEKIKSKTQDIFTAIEGIQ
jgi:uncharacterized protein (UPF0333 family)